MNVEICIIEKNRSIIFSKDELQEIIKAIEPSARMFEELHSNYPADESITKFNNIYESMIYALSTKNQKKIELPYLSLNNLISEYNSYAETVVTKTRKKGIEPERDVHCIKLNELHMKMNSFFHSLD